MSDSRLPGQPQSAHPQQPARPVQPVAQPIAAQQPPRMNMNADDLEPLALVEEDELAPVAEPQFKSKIRALGPEFHQKQHNWKRQPHSSGAGAIRVKSFHGKYSDQGLEHMDDVINVWIDAHPEVEIKFVTSTVGVFEGKIREPALVLNLWY